MKHDDDDIEDIFIDNDNPHADPEPVHPKTSAHSHAHHASETQEEYKKLYKVLGGIFVVATLLSLVRGWDLNRAFADFMAVWFITFAAFKFQDIEAFAHTYRTYDYLAARIRPWGYAYPFIELFLGFWYLLSQGPLWLNVLTMLVTGSAAWSVRQKLKEKRTFTCACLGTFIKLPLSKVSWIENATMFVMAVIMMFL